MDGVFPAWSESYSSFNSAEFKSVWFSVIGLELISDTPGLPWKVLQTSQSLCYFLSLSRDNFTHITSVCLFLFLWFFFSTSTASTLFHLNVKFETSFSFSPAQKIKNCLKMNNVYHRAAPHSPQEVQSVQHLSCFSLGVLKSCREEETDEEWRKEKETKRGLVSGGNDGRVGEKVRQMEGEGWAGSERGKRSRNHRRWRLCGSADVWTVGGQGRWVVALEWVLTESFLTWRFTQALSNGGRTRVNDPFSLVMNIYLVRAFTGCCVEWQMVVNYLYSIPIYSLGLFHLWLTHLINGSVFTWLFMERSDRTWKKQG